MSSCCARQLARANHDLTADWSCCQPPKPRQPANLVPNLTRRRSGLWNSRQAIKHQHIGSRDQLHCSRGAALAGEGPFGKQPLETHKQHLETDSSSHQPPDRTRFDADPAAQALRPILKQASDRKLTYLKNEM